MKRQLFTLMLLLLGALMGRAQYSVLNGDLTHDGKISVEDMTMIANINLEKIPAQTIESTVELMIPGTNMGHGQLSMLNGDLTHDGSITEDDMTMLANIILEKSPCETIGSSEELNYGEVSEAYLEEGVSWKLAQHRKATISNLRYSLFFDISADKDAAIEASERLSFDLATRQDLILDFREQPSLIHNIMANGKECEWRYCNEHLIIPSHFLQPGTNEVSIDFTAGTQSLNRRDEYIYTLFVPDRARTVFPCMEQPDMKARFTLSLRVPEGWKAVTNSKLKADTCGLLTFAETEPLPTYLFAFAAGIFEHETYEEDGHSIGIYHRETDAERLSQLSEIGHQVVFALQWQEAFTGVPYPFQKYDLVILPGFQFGGMEHTGATFYNDNTIFLSAHPTPDEELRRTEVISHETSHMWFGDAVTMNWFDDVWTKEVFANYFAAEITAPLFPSLNHRLNWMKTYINAAMSEDRTSGGTSIRQPLDNMRYAGLVYNQIIYNKAPVMLRKLVELMGEEPFRRGIQRYVQTFLYGNASWEDLVDILDAETPEDVRSFSDVWVNQKGVPTLMCELDGNSVRVTESDPYGRGLHWPQTCEHRVVSGQILPNYDGRGYGYYTMNDAQLFGLLDYWPKVADTTARQSLLMTLYENYLHGRFDDEQWATRLVDWLKAERDVLTASTIINDLYEPLQLLPAQTAAPIEEQLVAISRTHQLTSARTQLLRLLYSLGRSEATVRYLYSMWEKQEEALLSERDYMSMACELALRLPEQYHEIYEAQLNRITNNDRRQEFRYIFPSVSPSAVVRDSVFQSLSIAENRRIEPWTLKVLYNLNHPIRSCESVKYIQPALELLPDIQHTGDIFFPGDWCLQLLAGHRSPEALSEVETFLAGHKDYPQLLTNKILLGKYWLERNVSNKIHN